MPCVRSVGQQRRRERQRADEARSVTRRSYNTPAFSVTPIPSSPQVGHECADDAPVVTHRSYDTPAFSVTATPSSPQVVNSFLFSQFHTQHSPSPHPPTSPLARASSVTVLPPTQSRQPSDIHARRNHFSPPSSPPSSPSSPHRLARRQRSPSASLENVALYASAVLYLSFALITLRSTSLRSVLPERSLSDVVVLPSVTTQHRPHRPVTLRLPSNVSILFSRPILDVPHIVARRRRRVGQQQTPIGRQPYNGNWRLPSFGRMSHSCTHCDALHWVTEHVSGTVTKPEFGRCCQHGAVKLDPLPDPPGDLYTLLTDGGLPSRRFRTLIRQYNSALTFTSFTANQQDVNTGGRGPWVWKNGYTLYHNSGSLLPQNDARPVYTQLYFYDAHDAHDFRMNRNPKPTPRIHSPTLRSSLSPWHSWMETVPNSSTAATPTSTA
jgi:hypothetical protein